MQRLTMDEIKVARKIELPEVPEVPELVLEPEKVENPQVAEDTYAERHKKIEEKKNAFLEKVETPEETETFMPLFEDLPDIDELSKTLEAMLFVSKDPLKPDKVKQLLGLTSIIPIRQAMDKLKLFYEESGRAYELREIADGYLLQTRTNYDDCIQRLRRARRELKITQNALTTLSIVAYKQPITRSEIDAIRGANSSHHMRSLLDNELIKVVGKKEAPGSPRLYGTTRKFLEIFGLKSITGLPKSTEAFEEKIKEKKKSEPKQEAELAVVKVTVVEETANAEELREITGKKREIIDPDEFN